MALAAFSGAFLIGKGFWMYAGIVCVMWAQFSKVRFSVFKAESENIFVIQDKKHDEIISELNVRRKTQPLSWYGEIDPENDLEREVDKFKWLVEQKILTKEESDRKISEAELFHNGNFDVTSQRLN